ncbi:PQQ-binding-like beta-propeller repeat protein [Francisella marina]|uniref:Outer membrane protein assembly factor BamB n=1 Tax=Francisella marina TaxID=2249302 RepID=A0ABX5ZHJ1_9GAMM|nr:outer membrane protein assembly factor BamB [Francisella marina]QEO57632.1 outer membrane protein assembly factor BamB [Francisella marina]QEO58254.1 outer membrane protein assembly factor BamB [Francisella marina]
MKKLFLVIVPLLLSLLATSCSTSNVPPPTPLAEKPPKEAKVKVKWSRKTGNGNGGLPIYNVSPTYANNTVFVPNQNGVAYGLSITDGKIIWKHDTGTILSSQPNTIANAVIFGSVKGVLTAVDQKDGKILWRTDAPSSIFSQPTIYSNHLYTHTHDGSVTSFDATNGSKVWNVTNNIPEITLPSDSSPIILNDTVMVGSAFGTVLGFTLESGDRTINLPVAIAHGSSPADKMVDITANPMLYGNYLIFAAFQGAIVALDKDTGKMLWAKKASIINNMAINNGVIFTAQANSELKAYDIQTGDTVWTQSTLEWRKITAPIYYKGLIVVADYQGFLHFFNSLNGDYLGRYKLTPKSDFFDYGISGQLVPTEKGILIEADSGTTYLVDAHSDRVIYENILGDYKVDRGQNVKVIYPLEQPKSVPMENTPKDLSGKEVDSDKSKNSTGSAATTEAVVANASGNTDISNSTNQNLPSSSNSTNSEAQNSNSSIAEGVVTSNKVQSTPKGKNATIIIGDFSKGDSD